MDSNSSYESEIQRLNKQVYELKNMLQKQQLSGKAYEESITKSQNTTSALPKDLNPILKQIRKKNLSLKEKQKIIFPDLYPSYPEDIYYQWIAPSRVTIKRDKQWFWTMGLVLMIIITIAVILREMIWVAVALAFFFTIYINASIPAEDTIYRLTKQGVEIGEGDGIEIYSWDQLLDYSFYFKHGTELLYIDTILAMPQRIHIMFGQEDRKNINMILESHLPYKPAPKKQTWLNRYTEGVYIPLLDFKNLQKKIDEYYDEKYADIIFQLKKEGKIPQDVTVEDIRNAESIQTLKLVEEIQKREEAEIKKILGI